MVNLTYLFIQWSLHILPFGPHLWREDYPNFRVTAQNISLQPTWVLWTNHPQVFICFYFSINEEKMSLWANTGPGSIVHTISMPPRVERKNGQQMAASKGVYSLLLCGITYLLGMISTPHERKHKTFALDTKMLVQYPTWEPLTIWAFCDISHL